jgi:pullulanase
MKLITTLAVVFTVAQAHSAQTALADCNGAFARTLVATANAPADARAVWMNARLIRWPKQQEGGRYRLYYANKAGLKVRIGQKTSGAQGVLPLTISTEVLPTELAARYRYLGTDGVVLALSAKDQARLRAQRSAQWLLVHENNRGKALDVTALQIAGLLDAQYPEAARLSDLGVIMQAEVPQLTLWAPTARAVSACVYASARAKASAVVPLRFDARTGAWSAEISAAKAGQYYRYLVDAYVQGVGWVRNLVSDPYAVSLSANGVRSYIADLADPDLAPPGWAERVTAPALARATDMSIYELHVRDFSANDTSVPAPHRGKYLAFAEADSLGSKHLAALAQAGMTDIHLLPVFDFATVPEQGCVSPSIPDASPDGEAQQAAKASLKAKDCFNWGYDPQHFGAPEGSYASDAEDGAVRIREFRAMVDALHRAKLRVGMDVVYNHTSNAGQHEHSVLDRIVPGYYHRLDANGKVERSTCCDNTATENTMMQKLMIDTAVRWVRDYRIDSFRFDLMGHQPRAAMEALQKAVDAGAGRKIFLLGEGWNFGEVANNTRFVQAAQLELGGSGIATFSDRARDAARGGGCCDGGVDLLKRQGYLNGLSYAPNALNKEQDQRQALLQAADLMRLGLAGSIQSFVLQTHTDATKRLDQIDYSGQAAGYVSQPTEVVNYVENHDNPTLFDVNVLKLPTDTSSSERARVQILGAASVAFSQGIAYFHAGMEGLRSKSLDRNSFDSGDWFNRLDWRFQDNFFGTGLPSKADNANNYALFKPLLANAAIKPNASEIQWTRDAFFDLLRIRASTQLLRLDTAADIEKRLRFLNTGSKQEATVLAAVLDGTDLADAGFLRLAYFINVDTKAHTISDVGEHNQNYVLHPVHLASQAADLRARAARYDAKKSQFSIPPRTAVVFVVPAVAAQSNAVTK